MASPSANTLVMSPALSLSMSGWTLYNLLSFIQSEDPIPSSHPALFHAMKHTTIPQARAIQQIPSMHELQEIVAQRLNRIKQLSHSSPHPFRIAKEEEANRTAKENAILSALKLNRNLVSSLKLEYFHLSLSIMKQFNEHFCFDAPSDVTINEQFLECFVRLYKAFFKPYEESMQFKTRLDSYIRATNHNVVTDLVKYLIDFTRDSYHHIFLWTNRLKSQPKIREKTLDKLDKWDKVETSREPPIDTRPGWDTSVALGTRLKFRSRKTLEVVNVYDVLETSYPTYFGLNCKSTNPYLKTKINELFKDFRNRNTGIRQMIQSFHSKHSPKDNTASPSPSKTKEDIFPVELILVAQKVGPHWIHLEDSSPKRNIRQPAKEILTKEFNPKPFRIEESKIESTMRKSSFIEPMRPTLTSLKILRITDHTLPPIFLNKKFMKPLDNTRESEGASRQSSVAKYFDETVRKVQEQPVKKMQEHSLETEERLIEWLNKIKTVKEEDKKRMFGLQIR